MQFSSIRKPKVKLEKGISTKCIASQIQIHVIRTNERAHRSVPAECQKYLYRTR